jgi:O-antigen biosynthesis protein
MPFQLRGGPKMQKQRHRIVVVLGMHRSGTSAIARALQVMGIDLGSKLMPPKKDENDFGFFEDLDLNQLNIKMLSALNSDWHFTAPLETDFPNVLRKKGYLQEAVSVLGEKTWNCPTFAFKDPRTTRLLPFWKQVFEHCHLDVSYVAAVRNPISVAQSLSHRNEFDMEKGIVLWVSHNLAILEGIVQENKSIFVDYDRFIDAPIDELNRISSHLGFVIDQQKLGIFMSEFHRKGLRHEIQDVDNVLLNDFTSRTAGQLWQLLHGAARAEGKWNTNDVPQQVVKARVDFEHYAPFLSWIDKLYESTTTVSALNSALSEKSAQIANMTLTALERDREHVSLASRNTEFSATILSMIETTKDLNHRLDQQQQLALQFEKTITNLTQAANIADVTISHLQQLVNSTTVRYENEALRLREQLIESENRVSELRSLIIDRDRKLKSLVERIVYNGTVADGAKRPGTWRDLVELDGLAFIREAYIALFHREPDPTGERYYFNRLCNGSPKLSILGELQNSSEGQRIHAEITGLRLAVRRQQLAKVPIVGNFLAQVLGAEKLGGVHMRMRAAQQQILGISSVIRSNLHLAGKDISAAAASGGVQIAQNTNESLSNQSGDSAINSGFSISNTPVAVRNRAIAGTKPFVFQFSYETTASPASVGQNPDSRELALGIRSLEITDTAQGRLLCEIDFRSHGTSRDFILFGFGEPENWGTWSVGKKSAIVVWHEQMMIGAITIKINALPFAGASPVAECLFASSLGHRKKLLVSDGPQEFTVELPLEASRNPEMLFREPIPQDFANNVSLSGGQPVVSIIILNFDKPHISILSARAVLASSIGIPYEIIVVDNGSSKESYETLQIYEMPVRLLRIPVNRYFGEGNNLGAEAARGEYLVFLNNDAFIIPGCIDALVGAFKTNPHCGAAGPLFRYPDERLQEAGAFIAPDGKALQRGKFDRNFDVVSLPEYDVVDYISAACLMIKASLFQDLGGFNYRYDPAYYEDSDLCLRVKLRGKSTLLVGGATCIHIENATTGDRENKSASGGSTVDHNKDVFLSNWGKYLANRSKGNLPFSLVPRSNVRTEKHVHDITHATYSPYPLVPGGGERYILAATLALNELGTAALITPDPYSRLRLDNVMFDLGLPIGHVGTFSVDKIRAHKLKCTVIMGNELFPHVLLPAEKSIYHCQFPFPEDHLRDSDIQYRMGLLTMCEKVIVNSEFTKRAYEGALEPYGRTARVDVVNPPVATERLLNIPRNDKPFVLSIGRFSQSGHDKRQDILIDAMKATSSIFRKDWTLILCGSVPNNSKDRAYFKKLQESVGNDINVKFVLSPSTSTVDELRSQCSIYAHACGYGVRSPEEYWKCEHFGITLVEALVAGCSIVCYEVGGGPEIIEKVGSGKTFGSIEELAFRLEEIADCRLDPDARNRTAQLYGDQAFAKRLMSAIS